MEVRTISIRAKALHSMRWSIPLLMFVVSAMIYLHWKCHAFISIVGRFITVPMAILCVPFAVNCVELISGKSMLEYCKAWNELNGWQRGILGTVIVIVSFLIMFLMGFTIAMQLLNHNS